MSDDEVRFLVVGELVITPAPGVSVHFADEVVADRQIDALVPNWKETSVKLMRSGVLRLVNGDVGDRFKAVDGGAE